MIIAIEALAVWCLISCGILVVLDMRHSLIAAVLWNQLLLLDVLLLGVRAHVHVIINSLFAVFWETFLSCHIIVFLGVILKEGLGCWRLRIVVAYVPAVLVLNIWLSEVLALLEAFFTDLNTASHG